VLLLVVAAACGGATEPPSDSTARTSTEQDDATTDASFGEAVETVVDEIVAAHGEDGGFDAVVWALERGYSADQVLAAAGEQRLNSDGSIADSAEGTEPPGGPPLGLILLPEPDVQSLGINAVQAIHLGGSTNRALFKDQLPIDDIDLDRAKGVALGNIISAMRIGYSPQQVVEYVVEGGTLHTQFFADASQDISPIDLDCSFLRDSANHIVVPELRAPYAEEDADYAVCGPRIKVLAESEELDREMEADVGDLYDDLPSDVGSSLDDAFHAEGPTPSTNEDVVIDSSLIALDFCEDGTLSATFFAKGTDSGPFTAEGNATGTWDSETRAGSVVGQYTTSNQDGEYGGEWTLNVVIAEMEVLTTDGFGQTVSVPITADAPASC